jgi:hypothetical protein
MRKLLILLATLAALAVPVLLAPPASAVDYSCLGYQYAASVTANGHQLSTEINVCGNYDGNVGGGNPYSWGTVAHAKCYRDGVLFGSGTGGCRWAGHLTVYLADASPDIKIIDTFWAAPGSSSGLYISDSGRQFSQTTPLAGGHLLRFCAENGQVHFVGATGVDYGLFNMIDHCVYHSSTP